jgi:hypothetical protein
MHVGLLWPLSCLHGEETCTAGDVHALVNEGCTAGDVHTLVNESGGGDMLQGLHDARLQIGRSVVDVGIHLGKAGQ